MGSVALKIGDGTARFRRATLCSSAVHLLMLSSVLTTNLFALYVFTSAPSSSSSFGPATLLLDHEAGSGGGNVSVISEHVALIMREIEASERRLHQIERELAGYDTFDPMRASLPPELKIFLTRHPLPLGRDSRSGITEMVASVAHSCGRSPAADLLSRYMSYTPAAPCPADDSFLSQKLIAKACEPLPRRRCLTRTTALAAPRVPFPQSLWSPGAKNPGAGIYGLDKQMWVTPRGKTDFLIDDVLALGGGGIRIGFEIGGGAGNFAARMAERKVTIVTSTLEVGGKPMNEFVAARGLFPLLLSPTQRFPFYDSVFDLVHTMNAIDEGGAPALGQASRKEALEFVMFDIDRVLRPGGLFWLDNYLCPGEERKRMITRLIERFGYKKLKWVVGEKADAGGAGKTQVYLSAVLQKPARN